MPQTREHLAILGLLGVVARRGSRSPRSTAWMTSASGRPRRSCAAVLVDSTLRDAPLFASSMPPPQITPAPRHCASICARWRFAAPARPREGLRFRLAVDRVFTLAGSRHGGNRHGVLGVGARGRHGGGGCHGAAANAGSQPPRSAASGRYRVGGRALRTQPRGHRQARAHARRLARGPTGTRAIAPRRRAARVAVAGRRSVAGMVARARAPGGPRTAVALASCRSKPRSSRPFGSRGACSWFLAPPFCAVPGDRFIIRDAQGRHTIGGGRSARPDCARKRRRRSPERRTFLDALELMLAGEGTGRLIEQAPFGAKITDLVRLTGRAGKSLRRPLPPPHSRSMPGPSSS